MTTPLITNSNNISLAMLGMVDGNGHPYSWSSIINGFYDSSEIVKGGYEGIVDYLSVQPDYALGIDGVTVTHICCDKLEDSKNVSLASNIKHVVKKPEDVIGEVDAVIIGTDIGSEHVVRAKPFIEAGIPVFIDKPLTDNEEDLRQFVKWQRAGKPFFSSSAMRYAREFVQLQERANEVGELRLIVGTMMKSWERYGIHILEAVYPFLPAGGFESVVNSGSEFSNIVHLRHSCGVDIMLPTIKDMRGGYGIVSVYGTKGHIQASIVDTFYAFKTQLQAFVKYLRTGEYPFPFEQLVEQMKIIIAGNQSREQSGKRIMLGDIKV